MRRRSLSAFALLVFSLASCGDDSGQTSAATASASETGTTTSTSGTAGTTVGSSPTEATAGTGSASQTSGGPTDSGEITTSTAGTTGTTAGVSSSTSATTETSETTETTETTGTTGTTGTTDTTDTGETTGTTGTTDTSDSSSGSTTGMMEACGCPDIEVPLDDGIFLLSDDAELWKYFPETNDFTMLGQIQCMGMLNTFSMAVDRLGYAWVQFNGTGQLRKVNVADVTDCTDPGYVPGQQGVVNFGMAFVSNSEADKCDRIYGNTYDGFGGYIEAPNAGDFVTIDPDTLILSKLGKTNFDGAELTGTGDGRAFIFGGAFPSKLVEADKTNGAAVDVLPLGGLEINNGAFAFAFFAGDFYFFTDSNNDFVSSEVTHLDYDDSDNNGVQDLTKLVNNAPLLVVGAGVSTCAPVLPM